jgi:hypothetical protein
MKSPIMASQIDEKSIRRKTKELLNQGISKQQTYELLIEEFDNRKITAEIPQKIPSSKAWKKYGIWNHVLSPFWS